MGREKRQEQHRDKPVKRRRPWWLRLLRGLGILVGVVLLLVVTLVVAALLVARRPWGQEELRQLALEHGRKVIPGLQIKRISGDLTSTLAVDGLVIKDRFGGEAVRVGRVALTYDLSRLLFQTVHVERIEIRDPVVLVRPTRSGAYNVAELMLPSPKKPEPDKPSEPLNLKIVLGQLKISGARATVFTGGKQPQVAVRELYLDLGASMLGERIEAQLRSLKLKAAVPGRPRISAELSARTLLQGKDLGAAISLWARGLTPGGKVHLDLSANGPLEQLRLGLSVRLPARGRVKLDGTLAAMSARGMRYDLTLGLEHLAAQLLQPGLFPTDLSLQVKARGVGVPLKPGSTANVDLQITPSSVMGVKIQSLRGSAALDGDRWTLARTVLKGAGAMITASGSGTLEQVDARARVQVANLARIQLPKEYRKMVPPLTGTLDLRGKLKGKLKGKLRAEAGITASGLGALGHRVGWIKIKAAVADLLEVKGASVSVEARQIKPGGDPALHLDRATVAASGDLRQILARVEASGPRLEALVVARTELSPAEIKVQLQQLRARFRKYSVALRQPTRVRLLTAGQILLARTRLRLLGGTAELDGSFRFKGKPGIAAHVRFADIVAMPGVPAVSGKLDLDVGRRLADARATVRLAGAPEPLELQLRMPVRYNKGSPVPAPLMSSRALQLGLQLKRFPLTLARPFARGVKGLDGAVSLALKVRGSVRRPLARLELGLADVAAGPVGGISGDLTLEVEPNHTRLSSALSLNRRRLVSLAARLDLHPLQLARGRLSLTSLPDVPLHLRLRIPQTPINTLPQLHAAQKKLAGAVSAEVDLRGTLRSPTARLVAALHQARHDRQWIGDVQLRADVAAGKDRTELTAGLRLAGRKLLQASVTLAAGLASLARRGGWRRAKLEARATVPKLPLSALKQHHAMLRRVGGTLELEARAGGTLIKPAASATVDLRGVRFDRVQLGTLRLVGQYDSNKINGELVLSQPGKSKTRGKPRVMGQLKATASFDPKTLESLAATVRADALDLGFVHKLTPMVQTSEGKLHLDLRAQGSLKLPQVHGKVRFTGGVIRLSGMPQFRDISMDLALSPRQLRLTGLKVRSGNGELTATATVGLKDLRPTTFGLGLHADRFKVGFGVIKETEINTRMRVDGDMNSSRLKAAVKIHETTVLVPELGESRKLHRAGPLPEVTFVDAEAREALRKQRKKAAGKVQAPLKLEITATADPVFLRGEQLKLELAANVQARTDDQQRPRLTGDVRIRRGHVKILSRKYEVKNAVVRFNGEPIPDPALNILLARTFPEATVFIGIQGSASKPELNLHSEPGDLDRSQILSLILTGRTERKGAGGDASRSVMAAMSEAAFGQLTSRIAPMVGADVMKVKVSDKDESGKTKDDALQGFKVEVELGKYITDRIYIGYMSVFGAGENENSHQAIFDYYISSKWVLEAIFGDAQVGGVDILWTHRY